MAGLHCACAGSITGAVVFDAAEGAVRFGVDTESAAEDFVGIFACFLGLASAIDAGFAGFTCGESGAILFDAAESRVGFGIDAESAAEDAGTRAFAFACVASFALTASFVAGAIVFNAAEGVIRQRIDAESAAEDFAGIARAFASAIDAFRSAGANVVTGAVVFNAAEKRIGFGIDAQIAAGDFAGGAFFCRWGEGIADAVVAVLFVIAGGISFTIGLHTAERIIFLGVDADTAAKKFAIVARRRFDASAIDALRGAGAHFIGLAIV